VMSDVICVPPGSSIRTSVLTAPWVNTTQAWRPLDFAGHQMLHTQHGGRLPGEAGNEPLWLAL
jgi:hypothetical protein